MNTNALQINNAVNGTYFIIMHNYVSLNNRKEALNARN